MPYQFQKLHPRFGIGAHTAQHGAGRHAGPLFFHAAHHHAQVLGLDHNADAFRTDFFVQHLGDLLGQALLNLQAAGKHLDDAGNSSQITGPPQTRAKATEPAR